MEEFCDIRQGKSDKPIIYFFHGYDSGFARKEWNGFTSFFNKKGYTTYSCDARGNGSRKYESNVNDLIGTVMDYDTLITKNKKESILVGLSIGGMEALKIGSKNPYVSSIFAISSPHDGSDLSKPDYREYLRLTYRNPLKTEDMQKILPIPKTSKKVFLIHDVNDNIVSMDHFIKNKDYFGVKEENTLVYNHKIHTDKKLKVFHVYPIAQKRTKIWIEKKL